MAHFRHNIDVYCTIFFNSFLGTRVVVAWNGARYYTYRLGKPPWELYRLIPNIRSLGMGTNPRCNHVIVVIRDTRKQASGCCYGQRNTDIFAKTQNPGNPEKAQVSWWIWNFSIEEGLWIYARIWLSDIAKTSKTATTHLHNSSETYRARWNQNAVFPPRGL